MSSTLPPLPVTSYQGHYYIPAISSLISSSPLRGSHFSLPPLSSRDGNIPSTRILNMSTSPPLSASNKSEDRIKRKPFSSRVTRVNPLIHNRDDGREARRNLFLRKVRNGSKEKRWEAWGGDDEIMRILWLAEERRRTEQQLKEASSLPLFLDEELEAYDQSWPSGTTRSIDEEMADEVAQQEDAEIEALVSLMDEQDRSQPSQQFETPDTSCDSDDEYDHLFMSVIKEGLELDFQMSQPREIDKFDGEMMDTN